MLSRRAACSLESWLILEGDGGGGVFTGNPTMGAIGDISGEGRGVEEEGGGLGGLSCLSAIVEAAIGQ